jgi:hypothetical protein
MSSLDSAEHAVANLSTADIGVSAPGIFEVNARLA